MDALTTARVVISLAVVLGVIWFLSRRLRGGAAASARKQSRVQVLGKTSVAPKASVVVVETEGVRLVLGVTEHGMSVLHSADAPAEAFASALAAASPAPAPAPAAASPAVPAPVVSPSPSPSARLVGAQPDTSRRQPAAASAHDANAAALAPQFRDRRAIFYGSVRSQVKALLTR